MDKNNKLWELYPHIWKTKSSYFSWVRGGVRLGLWNKHPLKLEVLKENTIMIKNNNERSKKRFPEVRGGVCNVCKGVFRIGEMEVDHLDGNHQLNEISDIGKFIEAIVLIRKEDLQLICKECHRDKSYSDRHNVPLKQAVATRKAIALIKSKRDKDWISERGLVPESNQPKRREQIINFLMNNGE